MSAEIFVELPADASGELRIGRMRKNLLEPVPLASFRGTAGMKAVAFAPALLVSRFRAPVTARSDAEGRRAALCAVEDELGQPIEDVALALGPKEPSSNVRDAYIVDQALLRAWREQLEAIGLGHASIVAENSLRSQSATVWAFDDRVLMTRADACFAIDAAMGEDEVRGFIAAAGFAGAPTRQAESLATLAALHLETPGVVLDSGAAARSKGLRSWQTAAALAGAGLLIWTVTLALETRAQVAAAQQAEQTARQMFRAQFPGSPEPQDIHTEVRRIAQAYGSGAASGFQPMAAALFKAIAASDTVQLNSLSYSVAESALEADLQFAGAADEAAFRARLEPAGLRLETAEVTDTSDGVRGRFTLRGAP